MVDAFSDSHDDNGVSKPSGIDEDKLAQDGIRRLNHRFLDHIDRDKDPKPLFLEMNYNQCRLEDNYKEFLDNAVGDEIRKHFVQAYCAAIESSKSSTANDSTIEDGTTDVIKKAAEEAEEFAEHAIARMRDNPIYKARNEKYGKKRLAEVINYPVVYVVYGNEETGAYGVRPELESSDGDAASVTGYDNSSSNGDSREFPDGVNKDRYTGERGFTVYVGETNGIARRVTEHLDNDSRKRPDWEEIANRPESYKQILISDQYFTKSMTEDIEDRLIDHMMGIPDLRLLMNRRGNPQGDYHESELTDSIFREIWNGLGACWREKHPNSPNLFPDERVIFDSAIYKASPFHHLNKGQVAAADIITDLVKNMLDAYAKSEEDDEEGNKPLHSLILVAGAAGTGKTVLLSYLFNCLYNELAEMEDSTDHHEIDFIVNQDEQLTVYDAMCRKLGRTGKKASGKISVEVNKAASFIQDRATLQQNVRGRKYNYDEIKGNLADVVLIDEAHLLRTQNYQGYQGGNQLYDIIKRSKVTIAVFDPDQILQKRCNWSPELISALFPSDWRENAITETDESKDAHSSNAARKRKSFEMSGVELPLVEIKNKKKREKLVVDVSHVELTQQMRIDASEETRDWINNLVSADGSEFGVVKPIPVDFGEMRPLKEENYRNLDGSLSTPDPDNIEWKREPYEIKVFDSPVELFQAIYKKAVPNNDGEGVSNNEGGLSRVIATYDWPYTEAKVNPKDPCGFWNVEMKRKADGNWEVNLSDDDKASIDKDIAMSEGCVGSAFVETFGVKAKDVAKPNQSVVGSMPTDRFCMPWNREYTKYASLSKDTKMKEALKKQASDALVGALEEQSTRFASKKRQVHEDLSWAEQDHTVFEVGSIYTIQGFDLNVAGVIIGPSVKYRDGRVRYDPEKSKDNRAKVKEGTSEEDRKRNIRNQFNVLVKRGVHGLYLFAVDEDLRKKLREEYATYEEKKKKADELNKKEWRENVEDFNRELEAVRKQEEREDEEEEASLK